MKQWAGTTFGSSWMHKSLVWMLRYIDAGFFYFFASVFVVPFVLIFGRSRSVIYRYMRKRMGFGRLRAAWYTYLNHSGFAEAVIDKFAMYAGKRFKVDIEGYDYYLELAKRDEPFLQLSSHIGNYEIAGYTLKAEKILNAVVYFNEKEIVMRGRDSIFRSTNVRMIPVANDMSHLFLINSALEKGEVVSIPADRIWGSSKKIDKEFLGATASFPYGPFTIATIRSLDVISVHVMKSSHRQYNIYVKPLEYDKTASRGEQVRQLSDSYVKEMERILKLYPRQWYNYFDFWQNND